VPCQGAGNPFAGADCAARITTVQPDTEGFAAFVAGFIVAEGTFTASGERPIFRFAVALGAEDAQMCESIRAFLGRGSIHRSPRRRPHYDDEVSFSIGSLPDHLDVVIPFMDAHLPPSYKRTQYLAWKGRLLDYWEHRAKRVRPCKVDGCDEPRRAHGVCRKHLYAHFGV
jgi:hypothetical protein